MKTLQQIVRFEKLHQLIAAAHTGTPQQLADHLGVSRSTVYDMIDYLKEIGATVRYSRSRMTFYYTQKFQLKVQINVTVLNEKEKRTIIGGCFFLQKNVSVRCQ